jgi:hypothetical protein
MWLRRELLPTVLVAAVVSAHTSTRLRSLPCPSLSLLPACPQNVAFFIILFVYQPFCGWSGQAVVDDISSALYNVRPPEAHG